MSLSTYWEAKSHDRIEEHTTGLSPATDEIRERYEWGPSVVAVIHVDGVEVGLTVRELEELSTAAERLARDARDSGRQW